MPQQGFPVGPTRHQLQGYVEMKILRYVGIRPTECILNASVTWTTDPAPSWRLDQSVHLIWVACF